MNPNAISTRAISANTEAHRCEKRHSGHVVQVYSSDDFLLDGLAGWIGKSLTLGETAIVVATHQHREGLYTRLKAYSVDLDLAEKQQR